MLSFVCVVICFLASAIGAVCGIGGGIIIKPVLDAFHSMDTFAINFLSGCTVLAMSTYSFMKSSISGDTHMEPRTSFPLALGAAAGGVIGRGMFGYVMRMFENRAAVSRIQAVCILILTIGTLAYTLCKDQIRTFHVTNIYACVIIGLFLGIISAFLGIGGGPINLMVLFFFFSMNMKVAAENSLYIIFFSQLTSFIMSVAAGVAHVDVVLLVLMSAGGIAGGICGRAWNKRISDKIVSRLFVGLMVVIIGISIYNIAIYSQFGS